MPSDSQLKTMNRLHRGLLKVSGGRFGWTAANMPVLELTTIGRKSSRPRSVMLTSPHRDGDMIVIVASKGGEDTHPAWFRTDYGQSSPESTPTTPATKKRRIVRSPWCYSNQLTETKSFRLSPHAERRQYPASSRRTRLGGDHGAHR